MLVGVDYYQKYLTCNMISEIVTVRCEVWDIFVDISVIYSSAAGYIMFPANIKCHSSVFVSLSVCLGTILL